MTNSETKKKVKEKLEVISVEDYYKMKPRTFEPNHVLKFLSFLDSSRDQAEILYDEVKDQSDSVFDYVTLEKFNNKAEKLSMAQAKAEATGDKRYKDVRVTLRERKHVFLYYKSLAKNGHSYCENLKQLTINDIAISKLSK